MNTIEQRLREAIKIDGENVIYAGELDNSGNFYDKVGQISGDQYYIQLDNEWYFVSSFNRRVAERTTEEELYDDEHLCVSGFEFDSGYADSVEDFITESQLF